MRTRLCPLLAIAGAVISGAVLAGAMASAAHALNINLTDTGPTPMSTAQLSAFQSAANLWESTYGDPITVNVNIEFADLEPNILGSTRTQRTTHPYGNVRSAMLADAFATAEQNAVNLLPSSSLMVQDINGTRSDNMVTMATANAKALGLGTGLDPVYGGALPGGADGRIQFANAFAGTFDYDRSDGIGAGLTDFIGVAAHEIGHLLGFFSATDVQDNNPGFTLHPNTLDLWRFNETGAAHAIGSETRRITHGPSEHYDSVLNNRQLSRGMHASEPDDPVCGTFSGNCQASHWRDDLGNLLDPTIAGGLQVDIRPDDRHAMDYVGYNRSLILLPFDPRRFVVGWFPWFPDPGPLIPDFDGAFREFAPPPEMESLQPPFEPDFAMRVGVDLGVEGMDKRGGLGLVQFAPEQPNQFPVIEGIPAEKGEETTEPDRPRPEHLPPALMDFYFESDTEAGAQFSARALFSESGAQFDPSLGKFGGYRIPLAVDGKADKEFGDTDALLTLLLLAGDESGVPNPEKQNLFQLATESDGANNSFQVFDFKALGLVPPTGGDYNGNGVVDAGDYVVWRDLVGQSGNNLAADGNADGMVDQGDYDLWKSQFGSQPAGNVLAESAAVPEPATGHALCILLTAWAAWCRRSRSRL